MNLGRLQLPDEPERIEFTRRNFWLYTANLFLAGLFLGAITVGLLLTQN